MNTLRTSSNNSRARYSVFFTAAALVCALSAAVSLSCGAANVKLWDVLTGAADERMMMIFLNVRVPRTAAAMLAGAALAASGALLQGALRNPLASPSVIGVNAGAGFGHILAAAAIPGSAAVASVAAFLGAGTAVALACLVGLLAGGKRGTVVLAGVAVAAFFSAGTDAVVTLVPDAAVDRAGFMIGGFAAVSPASPSFALACVIIPAGLILAILLAPSLNLLALGDEGAKSLGVGASLRRTLALGLAALLSAAAVGLAGLLGFVGLIAPHAVRLALGGDARAVVPGSMLVGAGFTALCDSAARMLFAPYELPVGIILSAVGGPFFIFLLVKRGRDGENGVM